jgi:hypothetical protein
MVFFGVPNVLPVIELPFTILRYPPVIVHVASRTNQGDLGQRVVLPRWHLRLVIVKYQEAIDP